MPVKCTYRKMNGGSGHEHIAALGWIEDGTGKAGESTRDQIVAFIDQRGTNALYCPDQAGGSSAWVNVRTNGYVRYPQTVADGRWTNNLLALPQRY